MINTVDIEQIKRLVETVNNMTFLQKFNGGTDDDRMTEFETANPDAAIQRLIDGARDSMSENEECAASSPCRFIRCLRTRRSRWVTRASGRLHVTRRS